MVVVAIVSAVVRQVVLQAGPRGSRVTAAKRNAVQQVTTVHVTPDTTGMGKNKGEKNRKWLGSGPFCPSVALSLVAMAIQCCYFVFSRICQFMGSFDFSFCVIVLIILVQYYLLI